MSRHKSTSDYRKDYTPEQRAAERDYRARRYSENQERLQKEARDRRAKKAYELNARDREARKTEPAEVREARLAKKRERYRSDRESNLAYAKAYTENNKEVIQEKARLRSPKRKQYREEYRKANAERHRILRKIWSDANADRIKQKNAEWSRNNLDRHRVHQANRRARKLSNGGTMSHEIIPKLFSLQRGRCAACKKKLGEKYDLDHIVPIALGGPSSDDNAQLLHQSCNRSKGAKPPIQYMQAVGFLL